MVACMVDEEQHRETPAQPEDNQERPRDWIDHVRRRRTMTGSASYGNRWWRRPSKETDDDEG